MVPAEMPTKLLVIGSGAIGVEFASFYNDMGADVTIVEMLPRILPVEDEEVSAFMDKALTKQGIKIVTGAGVERIETRAKGVKAKIKGKDGKVTTEEFSHVIVAIGIVPNTEDIGLEALGVEDRPRPYQGRRLCAAPMSRASTRSATSPAPPWLAHKASHEGIVCVEAIAGEKPHPFETWNIPGCTYSRPQVA